VDKNDATVFDEWLKSNNINIDSRIFVNLFAFTRFMEVKYPDNPDRSQARRKMILERKKGELARLSEIFGVNAAECAELAALAQYYLQKRGINSKFISGEVAWNKDDEYPEEHSYILIENEGKKYIYDPANPVNAVSGKYPGIYEIRNDFEERIRDGHPVFIAGKNLISKKEAYYGVGDHSNILANEVI
jgi:hypothetical protein